MAVKVKICGITNQDDATWALNYGADYIGLNFWKKSPRHVSVATAGWAARLPPFASLVGVFVDPSDDEVVKAATALPLKMIQLHGAETPAQVTALRVSLEGAGRPAALIKAIRVRDASSLEEAAGFATVVDYFLLDAWDPARPGGTGQTFNWDLARRAGDLGKPVFLAGGLTPENVADAVRAAAPFAVDTASGVERSARRKDPEAMRKFIETAKGRS